MITIGKRDRVARAEYVQEINEARFLGRNAQPMTDRDSTCESCLEYARSHPSGSELTVSSTEVETERKPVTADQKFRIKGLIMPGLEKLTPSQQKQQMGVIQKHSKVIPSFDGDLGKCSVIQHEIKTGDAKPVSCPPRPISFAMR